jgi:serine/threonine-protein kinase haspin
LKGVRAGAIGVEKGMAKGPAKRAKATKKHGGVHTPIKVRQQLECVEIPSTRQIIRAAPIDVIDLTEDLQDLSIAQTPSKPPSTSCSSTSSPGVVQAGPQNPLDELVRACTGNAILPFDTFLSSQAFLDLMPSRAQAGITKIGEASYSEVYSVRRGKYEVVIKVVPLFPDCKRKSVTEIPDCSSPDDVLREVEITKTMSNLPDGGFVGYRGYVFIPIPI